MDVRIDPNCSVIKIFVINYFSYYNIIRYPAKYESGPTLDFNNFYHYIRQKRPTRSLCTNILISKHRLIGLKKF